MQKKNVREIFAESITKLNSIISFLDQQLGAVSLPESQQTSDITMDKCVISSAQPVKKKEVKEKQPKKEEKKPQGKNEDKSILFQGCELKVGKIVSICKMENSEVVYIMKVDLGESSLRDIGAGLQKYVSIEELSDSNVIIFANLKPKKLGDFISNGMVMCSSDGNHSKIEVLRPNENAKPGERVFLENMAVSSELPGQLSSNRFEKVIENFKTDENCLAAFAGIKLKTESGWISAKTLANSKIS